MRVEYLQVLAASEFENKRRLKVNRKLSKDLKTLNDDLIGDIIDIKIDSDMFVSTLYALETIFLLRLQLARVSWAKDEPNLTCVQKLRLEWARLP